MAPGPQGGTQAFAAGANGSAPGFVPGEKGAACGARIARVEEIQRRRLVAAFDAGAKLRRDLGKAPAGGLVADEADVLDAGAERAQHGAGLIAAIEERSDIR